MENNLAQKVAEILLSIKAVTLSPQKPYRYASGILSPVYTDCRILISLPKERKKIRNLYIKKILSVKKKFNIVAGTATAGIPHAAWIADALKLPMIYVRGKPKDHGKGNQIEGTINNRKEAMIIEDLISTGESSCETARVIRNSGGKADYIFAIITYGMEKSINNFKKNKVKLVYLTDFKTIINVAEKKGYIKEQDKKTILDWIKDPPSWGKRMGFE